MSVLSLYPPKTYKPEWTSYLPNEVAYPIRQLEDIRFIVIHHSGVSIDCTAQSLIDHHINKNGWPWAGYHFSIRRGGAIERLNTIESASYHVAKRNYECVGIHLCGNFMNEWPTEQQFVSALELITYLQHIIPQAEIVGHRDIALVGWETSCPGNTWSEWKKVLVP